MYPIKQSTAITVPFFVHDASGDAVTSLTDGSFTKRISKNGAAFGAMTVTITEMENGWYSIPLSTSHSDTLGLLTVVFTNAGAKQVNLQFRVTAKLTDDLNDVAATDIVSAGAITTSSGAVSTVTTLTGHTAQTGDSFARLGAPAGASIAADLVTIDTVVDGIQTDLDNATDGLGAIKTDTAAILVDTADMQPKIGTPAADVSADIAAVKAETALIVADTNELQTDDVPGLIAALNDPTAATIAAAVWDEDATGHQTGGTFGQAIGDPALNTKTLYAALVTDATGASVTADVATAQADLDILTGADGVNLLSATQASIDAIEADTNELQTDDVPGLIAALNDPTAATVAAAVWDALQTSHVTAGSFGEIATEIASILTDTADMQPKLGTPAADLSADIAAVKVDTAATLVDTAEIGTAGAGLTAVPWNASWDAEVESEVNDALDTAIAELGVAAPTATPTLRTGIMLLYMMARNKLVVQTSGTDAIEVYNDAGTKIASKLITDDGSDYTEAEMA